MKVVYTIAGMYRPAGMERVLAGKANWLAAHGYEVLIVTTDQLDRPVVFPLDKSIRMVDLGVNYEENNGGSFIKKLAAYPCKRFRHRKALKVLLMRERADVVVSMFCGDERFITKFSDGSKKLLEVHFSRFKRLQYGRKGLWALADRLRSNADMKIVRRFDRFIALTKEDLGYWGAGPNMLCIPNARTFRLDAPASLDAHRVIAVGRYSAQKALDRLLNAWALCDRGDWKLALVGGGELEDELKSFASGLGIADSVEFGYAEGDIRDTYRNASVLALSSLYEGLPMVLLEAQAAGLPIVAFDCKCGPADVVTDGKDGFIVPQGDVDGLAAHLSELMNDSTLRKAMGEAAFAASDRFDEEKIMNIWTSLFEELTEKGGDR